IPTEGPAPVERLALLVPLTGPLASAGRAVRDGFLSAHFAAAGSVHLDVLDSGLTRESAVEAYVDAVTRGAQRVIGPLPRDQVAAVFAQPQLPVPLLALNAGEDDEQPPVGSHVFGLAPEEEGAAIAHRLVERNLRAPLLILNHEDWSQRAAKALTAHLELDNARPAARIELPSGVDFSTVLDGIAAHAFDAVVLALRPQQARLLLAQWRERGLPVHPWLATSHIYSGSPNRSLDRDLEGVEFSDAPWLADLSAGLPARAALKRELSSADAAPRLFALGLDAYRLVPYLDALRAHPDAYLDGANGQLTVDSAGRVRRLPAWLRFVEGQPRATAGALLAQ
ncbi:MAG: penicillin-binding protein activator, partial [Lysobacterales bacterium]